MKIKKNKILYFVLICSFFLLPTMVDAKSTETDGQVCVDGKTYSITDAGENVQLSKITIRDIKKGCYKQLFGKCRPENKFTAVSLGISCGITEGGIGDDNYTFYSCPLAADQEKVTNMYEVNEAVTQEWDASKMKWKVTISKAANYKIKLVDPQPVEGEQSKYREICVIKDENGDCQSYDFPGNNWYYPDGEGKVTLYITPGSDYFLAFYLNLGGQNTCDGAYMGYIQGAGSNSIPNPLLNRPICVNYRQQVANGDNNGSGIASALVNECFDENIPYDKLGYYTDAKIQEDINNANGILTHLSTGTVTDKLQCSFDQSKNSNTAVGSSSSQEYTKFLDNAGGTYWKALCTEKLVISYEQPKGVSAGQGFTYAPVMKMERTCTPIQIKKPELKEQCRYSTECWGGPANHTGEPGAGPTPEFDECVQKCDGGKYTQDCINKCYVENYTKNTPNMVENPMLSMNTLYDNDYKISPVAFDSIKDSSEECAQIIGKPYGPTRNPISSCQVTVNNYGCPSNTTCVSEHGVYFTYLDGCNSSTNPTKCYEIFVSSPNCSDNPQQDYQNQINQSLSELQEVYAVISAYTSESLSSEDFSASINDSHTKETLEYGSSHSNGNSTSEYDKKRQPDVNVEVVKQANGKDYTSEVVQTINSTVGNRNVELKSYKVTREVKLNLDYAYVSKTTAFDIIYGKHYYDTHTSIQNSYYPGEMKYFTNVNAKGVNLYEKWPTVIGFDNPEAINEHTTGITQNIHYTFKNVGSWKQWSNIDLDCFYGIKNGTQIVVPNDCSTLDPNSEEYKQKCPTCNPGDICPSGGLTFIYRPIDLNQPFVERDPRWNWSSNAINDKFNINPPETMYEIQDKGYSIYDTSNQQDEYSNNDLDYEIILTKQSINRIRQYNREKNGEYLDYDMYCTVKDGAKVCKSSFLHPTESNTNNMGFTLVKTGLVGCNNQASATECARSYSDVRRGSN